VQGSTLYAFIDNCDNCVTNSANKIIAPPIFSNQEEVGTPVLESSENNELAFTVSPNPFTHTTTFTYTVTEENSPVSLRVYNVTGGRVATLVQEAKVSPGRYTAVLSGEGLPDGVYLYRLETGATVRTGKLLLQR
jgi:hypothetical protein